ncbi:MAG: LamG domain-containing protein, partial [Planctomycetota bacterium]
MFRKSVVITFAFLMALTAVPVFGVDLLAPGDFIIAIDADGGSNSPAAEPVEEAIDRIYGGGGQKYLNFGEENSGFIVTPSIGVSIVSSFEIWTANDAEDRDPATWELYGTNDSIASTNHSTGMGESWTLIASGPISLPADRNSSDNGPGGFRASANVTNSTPYASYKMLFPTVKDAGAANSMQIAEVQFYGDASGAHTPVPADGSYAAPEYWPPNVYMLLDYTPGSGAITHTAYFSDVRQEVVDRLPSRSLGSVPPWPAVSPTAFVVGYDDPGIPEYARAPLVPGTTYYWCIDTDDGSRIWPGPVWSFTPIPKEAWGPYPADGALYIHTDVTATWNLGDLDPTGYSLSYDVYIGTDETAVTDANVFNNPSVAEFAGNVAAESYDFTGLAPFTEHFWRVDTKLTLTRPPFTSKYAQGDVWSFTTLPVVDINDPNLVGWWRLDGDLVPTMAFDHSGYANHGELRGDVAFAAGDKFVAGQVGNALDFDGGDYVYTGKSTTDLGIEGNNPRSVSVWVLTRNFNNGGIYDAGGRGTDGIDFCLRTMGTDNLWRVQYWGADTFDADFTYPSLNEWVHFGHVHDGTDTKIYANGDVILDVPRTLITASAEPFQIGCYGWQNDYFDGLIDDLRLYNRALSAKEVRILGGMLSASNPDPVDDAVDVSRTPTLTWTPGVFAAAVNGSVLYYSEDESAVINRTAPSVILSTPSFAVPITLDLGASFYWAVDTVNGVETWPGDVWSFTTTDWLSVDDMETYTPWTMPGNNIFEAWRDGEGNCTPGNGNQTGSTLTENIDAAFVLGGFQSMKYEFDNDGMVYSPCTMTITPRPHLYSRIEAQTATLPSGIGSDWTVEGVKALQINFLGQLGNATTEPLWVQLQDSSKTYGTKVFYGDQEGEDLADMNDPSWHQWDIDLADFNVNLSNVVSIVIGIGTEGATTAGGSGTIYIDEMRLYVPRCVPARASAAFGKLDFSGPGGAPDCVVDRFELGVMSQGWLQTDSTAYPEAVTTGPVAHYNFEYNLLDSSGNGNNGTAEAAATYVASNAGMGQALDFNGVADAVDCGNDPSVDIVGEVTISAWIRLAGSGGDRKVAGNQSAGGGYKMTIFGNDNLEFEVRDGSGGVLTRGISGGTALQADEWYYVVGVCSSADGYLKTYVDGELDKEMAISSTLAASGNNLILGREPYNTVNYFAGTMDD